MIDLAVKAVEGMRVCMYVEINDGKGNGGDREEQHLVHYLRDKQRRLISWLLGVGVSCGLGEKSERNGLTPPPPAAGPSSPSSSASTSTTVHIHTHGVPWYTHTSFPFPIISFFQHFLCRSWFYFFYVSFFF